MMFQRFLTTFNWYRTMINNFMLAAQMEIDSNKMRISNNLLRHVIPFTKRWIYWTMEDESWIIFRNDDICNGNWRLRCASNAADLLVVGLREKKG